MGRQDEKGERERGGEWEATECVCVRKRREEKREIYVYIHIYRERVKEREGEVTPSYTGRMPIIK